MDIKKNIIIVFATTLLGGCGSVGNIKDVEPSKYVHVTDYLNDAFEKSNCVDSIFSPQGRISTDADGLKYQLNGENIRCYSESIETAVEKYCVYKRGEIVQGGSWCKVNGEPLFYINYGYDGKHYGVPKENFMVVEQGSSQGKLQWLSTAERLGFLSKRVLLQQKLENEINAKKEATELQLKIKEKNTPVKADVGDLICKEDYEAKPYQYPGTAYYKAYVEKKEKINFNLG
ncbi:hypothetical protein [Escherichia coli]|uniref:hypothetical protein n=1 Tax=Escherichia coli TaxID=562 RepID=UPI0018E107C8|nr:hypothetical protein [Escherichia coli]EGJ2175706.1 hypothetical protein [Escherichia coli]MBI1440865.1 hypothetical protein [Escherichia coli]MBI1456715.1 hypothetical protein [Escherichia coli]MBI1465750.1 hypothetical protein [Escherichia coli]MBI1490553.1 hypothetical protein [Escherichia coli]